MCNSTDICSSGEATEDIKTTEDTSTIYKAGIPYQDEQDSKMSLYDGEGLDNADMEPPAEGMLYIHLFQISLSGPKATSKKLTTAKDFGNLLIYLFIHMWYLRSYLYER